MLTKSTDSFPPSKCSTLPNSGMKTSDIKASNCLVRHSSTVNLNLNLGFRAEEKENTCAAFHHRAINNNKRSKHNIVSTGEIYVKFAQFYPRNEKYRKSGETANEKMEVIVGQLHHYSFTWRFPFFADSLHFEQRFVVFPSFVLGSSSRWFSPQVAYGFIMLGGQGLGLMVINLSWKVFHDNSAVLKTFVFKIRVKLISLKRLILNSLKLQEMENFEMLQ